MVLSPQDPALLGRATADLDISSADADRCRASYGLTLIAAEAVEELTARDATLDSARPRRNVLTRGLDVNALVGRDPTIGDVRCRGLRPAKRAPATCGQLDPHLSGLPVVRRLQGRP